MNAEIKFVFFDMGKVLVDFDHQRMIDQVAALAKVSSSEMERILLQPPHEIENRFERGEVNGDEFHSSLCETVGCEIGKDA